MTYEMTKRFGTLMRASAAMLLLFAWCAPSTAHAQILSRGNLFGPGAPPPMVGVEIGFGQHAQQGTLDCNCGALFTGGTGTGLLGSVLFELPVNYEWAIGIKGGIDFKNFKTTTDLPENVIVELPNGDTAPVNMVMTRLGQLKATYFDVAPYGQYQFFRMGPFVQAGLDIGFLVSESLTQNRELITTSATIGGQTVNNLTFTNGTLEEPVPQTSTGFNSLRFGLLLSAGYNIQLSERSVFSPLLTYDFPLTATGNTNGSAWKIGSLYATAEIKFRLD
ncbi:MAG TPA: hypothetical protein VFH95_09380 [Candidatus Kapabacteria bacterium]|nr:hypothetical protein [Candidatus Kapabacteria bacterium]